MASNPQKMGSASRIFGDRYPYPHDGKSVLFEIANAFAEEFNEAAQEELSRFGPERLQQFQPLRVTSAYPTIAQHCPRISIMRMGANPKPIGIGGQYDDKQVSVNGETKVRLFSGQLVTEQIETSICTLSEMMRDDLYWWFQQYALDAALWVLPQLGQLGFYGLQCTNAVDDQVEYQGQQGQPGFEFYVARMTYTATYDMTIHSDVDVLRRIFNWERVYPAPVAAIPTGGVGELEGGETINPPDNVFINMGEVPE